MKVYEKVVETALKQVGYKAESGKKNKYAKDLDAIGFIYNYPKNGFDWCDIFVDWCFITAYGTEEAIKMLYQPKKGTGAGCKFSAEFFRKNRAWGSKPEPGRQIFFGIKGNESHTGIVIGYDSKYVYTVEGNTGGGNGAVNKRQYPLNSVKIVGYGIPKWSLIKIVDQNKKSNATVAKECILGLWGNGSTRKGRLKEAGYDYNTIQSLINLLLKPKRSDKQIALEVIMGKWGNGKEREDVLTVAGYNYDTIQKMVNSLLNN